MFSLYVPSHVILPLPTATRYACPQATSVGNHLGIYQQIQGVFWEALIIVIHLFTSIYWNEMDIHKTVLWHYVHFPLWLYRLFLELNSLLQWGQEYTKRFGKWIASIWFFTQVVVLFENLKHIPQVGIFSSFLIRNFSKSFGSLIFPEETIMLNTRKSKKYLQLGVYT